MNDIISYVIQMTVPAGIGVLLWAVTRSYRRCRRSQKGLSAEREREWMILFFFMYLAGLLALTLTPAGFWRMLLRGEIPRIPPPFQGGINLVPVRESWSLFQYYWEREMWSAIWINFPGNIIMFLPIGFFVGLLADKPSWWKGTIATFFLSAFIEFFQLFVSRGTDIDDVILNTLGGWIGYGFYLIVRKIFPKFTQRCARHKEGV